MTRKARSRWLVLRIMGDLQSGAGGRLRPPRLLLRRGRARGLRGAGKRALRAASAIIVSTTSAQESADRRHGQGCPRNPPPRGISRPPGRGNRHRLRIAEGAGAARLPRPRPRPHVHPRPPGGAAVARGRRGLRAPQPAPGDLQPAPDRRPGPGRRAAARGLAPDRAAGLGRAGCGSTSTSSRSTWRGPGLARGRDGTWASSAPWREPPGSTGGTCWRGSTWATAPRSRSGSCPSRSACARRRSTSWSA